MPELQLSLLLAQRHSNHQLFADRYLDVTLPASAGWRRLRTEAQPVRERIRAILAAYQPSAVEAQTEHDLVRPVLEALGHTFEVQVPLRTPRGVKRPDYVFYRSVAARNANKGKTVGETELGAAFAVGDAKHWERRLDVSAPAHSGEHDEINRIPAEQIAYYMLHSGARWGVLTNGRRWRLYHKESAQKQDRYYEVDLKDACAADDVDAFLYFYTFFRRAAFETPATAGEGPGAADGDLTLAAMLAESADYARGVSASLKSQVYEALLYLAQGFLDYAPNRLAADEATLQAIYANSLTMLYRLLFIFYAEARDLLPLRSNKTYREVYSLYAAVRSAAANSDDGVLPLNETTGIWSKLKDLFQIIDAGSPPLAVATFNGGLFDPAGHPFLEQYKVGDGHLQRALDQLARVGGEFIDYRDLAERHLGTIYEGLLEHTLQPMREPVWAQGVRWTVDLLDDKGERHRTGSYYTPDDIVQYIVEGALRPALEAAVAGKRGDDEKIEAIFALNCVDPSMGSGHFLVAAIDCIARFVMEQGLAPGAAAGGEADLPYWRRRAAQSCIYGVDLNPLAVELAKLSLWLATAAKGRPLSFLDHHLRCGNALVGASFAALESAAQPARRARAKGKAALALGDSQLSLLNDSGFAGAVSTAVDSMWLIESSAGATVADVKTQERLYEEVRSKLTARYATLAGLQTAEEFGVAIDRKWWLPLADYVRRGGAALFATRLYDEPLAAVEAVAASEHFFHWYLEFPEVFFDRFGQPKGANAGFDVVIGNPPYVRAEALGKLRQYLAAAYPATHHGAADLYIYFYDQGLRLLRAGGRLSYIVTNKWLRAGYGEKLRDHFAQNAQVERLIDFGHAPIFAEADVFPCIIVLRKPEAGEGVEQQQVQVTAFPRDVLGSTTINSYVVENSYSVEQKSLGRSPWSLEATDVEMLLQKIKRGGIPLLDYAAVRPLVGIKTGFNTAFLIDETAKSKLLTAHPDLGRHILPYLRGRDIKRWAASWEGLWLILLKSSGDYKWPWSGLPPDEAEKTFETIYPVLYTHMDNYRIELQKRSDQGQYWWELRSCSYYEVFQGTNIFYQDLAFHSRFCSAQSGTISEMTCFCLPKYDPWLLAVLNSPLMWSYLWRRTVHGKDEVLRLKTIYMEKAPIAKPPDDMYETVQQHVDKLTSIALKQQLSQKIFLDWIATEFDVVEPGQKIAEFWTLTSDDFVAEVQKRRPKSGGRLTPNALRDLRAGYAEQAAPLLARRQEAQQLERRLAALVNAAYGLTPEDVALLWRTAPPRMPVGEGDGVSG